MVPSISSFIIEIWMVVMMILKMMIPIMILMMITMILMVIMMTKPYDYDDDTDDDKAWRRRDLLLYRRSQSLFPGGSILSKVPVPLSRMFYPGAGPGSSSQEILSWRRSQFLFPGDFQEVIGGSSSRSDSGKIKSGSLIKVDRLFRS